MSRQYVQRHGKRIEVISSSPRIAPTRKRSTVTFIKMPTVWIDKLVGESVASHDLALLILQLNFKGYGRPVKLSNESTRHLGIHRATKWRALDRLVKLGLISVTQKPGSAPLVTPLR